MKILDDDGRELPPRRGRPDLRPPARVSRFHLHNNAAARRRIERDGLWTLGDMGYLDADGYLYVGDRTVRHGDLRRRQHLPGRDRDRAHEMPGVADCAVFGIPDAEFGEALAAAVQPNPVATLSDDVQHFLSGGSRATRCPASSTSTRAAARGQRQDLQAPAARALLGKGRPADLGGRYSVR